MFEELARRYGTPLFVYDLDMAARQVSRLVDALPSASALYYSLKANPHPDVVEAMVACGCLLEVSSLAELRIALTAGAAPDAILMTGPALSKEDIRASIGLGLRKFSVESEANLARLHSTARATRTVVRYLLRVNTPNLGRGRLRMAGRPTQFGTDLDAILDAPTLTSTTEFCEFAGLHFYSLSNAESEDDLVTTAQANLSAALAIGLAHRVGFSEIDLGGGFSAPYGTHDSTPAYPTLRPRLEELYDEAFQGATRPALAFESGRYLAAELGTLVATVQDVKMSKGRQFVILDAGVNHLGGMGAIGKTLPMQFDVSSVESSTTPTSPSTIVGPLCTPVDIISRAVQLPNIRPGAVVSIPAVGAYGLTASLIGFISRPIATEISVSKGNPISVTRLKLERSPVEAR